MKAIQLIEKNKQAQIIEVDKPFEKDGTQLIQVSYAALNHRDLWIVKGHYANIQYPIIPGSDLCGYIDGNRVLVNPGFYWGTNDKFQSKEFQILGLPQNGAFAEFVSVPSDYIYPVPDHLSDSEAAALPLAGVTAFRALFTKCTPSKGENLFITGIGGGVAIQVLQFAVAFGLNVYVSSSDNLKIEKAISLGAKGGVNYLNDQWDKELIKLCGAVQIIVDSAAGSSFNKLINVCAPAARICIYGGTQGVISDLSPQKIFWKQLNIHGSTMGTPQEFVEMLDYVESNKIIPVVDSIYNLGDASIAFEKMEKSTQFGKIVLKIKT